MRVLKRVSIMFLCSLAAGLYASFAHARMPHKRSYKVTRVIKSRKDVNTSCSLVADKVETALQCLTLHNESVALMCNQLHPDTGRCNPVQSTLVLRNGVVLERRGVVMDATNGVVLDVSGGCCTQNLKKRLAGERISVREDDLASQSTKPLVVAVHSHDSTYYHFTAELIRRLEFAQALSWIKAKTVNMYAGHLEKFHHKYWGLLLCNDAEALLQDRAPCYADVFKSSEEVLGRPFRILVLPPPPENVPFRFSRSALHAAVKLPSQVWKGAPAIVVLQRLKSRMVTNLKALVTSLQSVHPGISFLVVDEATLQDMALQETAEIFSNVQGLIGGHGAGLTNMLWMRASAASAAQAPSPFVAQIIRPGQTGNVYAAMAHQLGFAYQALPAALHDLKVDGSTADVVVNVSAAATLLDPLLLQARGGAPVERYLVYVGTSLDHIAMGAASQGSGVGNRHLGVLAASMFARLTGRTLLVHDDVLQRAYEGEAFAPWQANSGSLFLRVLLDAPIIDARHPALQRGSAGKARKYFLRANFLDDERPVLKIQSNLQSIPLLFWNATSRGVARRTLLQDFSEAARALFVPGAALRTALATKEQSLLGGRCGAGLHICGVTNTVQEAKTHLERTHAGALRCLIDARNASRSGSLFVASMYESSLAFFRNQSGGFASVVASETPSKEQSKEETAEWEEIQDLWLLSRCSLLVLNGASTFSRTAALLSKRSPTLEYPKCTPLPANSDPCFYELKRFEASQDGADNTSWNRFAEACGWPKVDSHVG